MIKSSFNVRNKYQRFFKKTTLTISDIDIFIMPALDGILMGFHTIVSYFCIINVIVFAYICEVANSVYPQCAMLLILRYNES